MSLSKRKLHSPTKGWRRRAPKRKSDRRQVHDKCGAVCFVGKNETYPVCAKPKHGHVNCKPQCDGLAAAHARAKQQHHPAIAKRALNKARRQGCPWAKA